MIKINFKYWITLFFILISARANILNNDICYIILLVVLAFLSRKKISARDVKLFVITFIVLGAFFYIRNKINGLNTSFFITDMTYVAKYVYPTWLFVIYMGSTLFKYIVKVVYHLACCSLFFYALQLIDNGAIIKEIGNLTKIINPPNTQGIVNFLVFNFQPKHAFRNSGFSWEPGAFGSFLVITLLFEQFITGFKITNKTKILTIAVLTTLSTTAYLAFLVLFLLKYIQNGGKIGLSYLLVSGVALLIFLNIPFLWDKIYSSIFLDTDSISEIDKLSDFYTSNEKSIPLGRFASIIFINEMFGWKQILGVANEYKRVYMDSYNVNLSCGIIDFVAKFGYIGYLFQSYSFIAVSKEELVYKGKFSLLLAFLVFFIVGFGETILITPFFLLFFFIPRLQKRVVIQQKVTSAHIL